MAGFNLIRSLLLCLVCCHTQLFAAEEAKQGKLEFRLADDEELAGWQKMQLPDSDEFVYVSHDVAVEGSQIEQVSFQKDEAGRRTVGFVLNEQGGKMMQEVTTNNVGRRLAIVLDGQIVSAPKINDSISKHGMISGDFDNADLQAFFRAIVLREQPD